MREYGVLTAAPVLKRARARPVWDGEESRLASE